MTIGRFAPSPTGALHAGSLVAALASWLDARAQGGRWLVRIEDVDTPRCSPAHTAQILQQLHDHGMRPDEAPLLQSQRHPHYEQALQQLTDAGLAYPCGCSRKDIAAVLARSGQQQARHGELVYPGTCHPSRGGLQGQPARAWRLDVAACLQRSGQPPDAIVSWHDRRLGAQQQPVRQAVGDFVLRRADGLWAYQLAVVVDDALQGITDVVRGEDLADNTARQIVLQQALGLPTPRYLHTPLVLGPNGEKLSKQNAAQPLPAGQEPDNLQRAAQALGLPAGQTGTPDALLAGWIPHWQQRYPVTP
ncbi:tRNA glutamyl-Q(34) synthetase GluQRS [Brachymonas chironomi]|uniref:tRNA glutamyl-Q(34) synthetase GluQRS n=1 Tax=Brachymonas chironomi TaxID=491919 RepID=UPI0003613734|nr:tRNA glutamyl-Q(34) synthetase GluQRS [Brachymonas chironomi]